MSRTEFAVCPHDCPSVCALSVDLDGEGGESRVVKVRGRKEHGYTEGVICAKVSRYAERIHHPDRLTRPLRRVVPKGEPGWTDTTAFAPCEWESVLDEIAIRWQAIIDDAGAEAIWPYNYAGTMGLAQRNGLDRLRRELGTSRQHSTYCVALSDAGWMAGNGARRGVDLRELEHSDLLVVWGGNPVNTQVNVMHYLAKARRARGTRLVVIDPYRTITAEKADLHLATRPGTDGALACAVMHCLLERGLADESYLASHSDFDTEVRAHLATCTPEWAASITGLDVAEIKTFADWYGEARSAFVRIGHGFTRSRNGASNMHAVSCLPVISGHWQRRGGGALYGHGDIYKLDSTLIQGDDLPPASTRELDQSAIGRILLGDAASLGGGPPVKALFTQNTNPAMVAPETARVLDGLARPDLFTVVHEQFLTDTARRADIVLPATMFLEHDDIYKASGHTYLQVSRQLMEPPGECRSNHWLLSQLAERLGLEHPAFRMTSRELCETTLRRSGLPDFDTIEKAGGVDLCRDHAYSHFGNGFGHPDGRFRFKPDWSRHGPDSADMPSLPAHWDVIDAASDTFPLRLVTAPARQFLNSSFTETPGSRRMEKRPEALMHPDDLARYGIVDGELMVLGNALGEVRLHARCFDGLQPGVTVVESQWPNADFPGGLGINTLVSAEPGAPNGGAVYHDTAVWARPLAER
ncbi:MAG: dehydrogenase [Gammaproteobacteria bacterium]|nr:MAG: dehydrogenase [Gammaproteobacteria bacterium]